MERGQCIPIEWVVPEDMPVLFANQLLVTHVDGQFLVTFLRAVPPLIFPGEESKMSLVTSVRAVAVARIAVPPQQIPGFIRALTANYEGFTKRDGTGEESQE